MMSGRLMNCMHSCLSMSHHASNDDEKCSLWSILEWCSYQPTVTLGVVIKLMTVSQFLYDWKNDISVRTSSGGKDNSSSDCLPMPLPNGIFQNFRLSLLQILLRADVININKGM